MKKCPEWFGKRENRLTVLLYTVFALKLICCELSSICSKIIFSFHNLDIKKISVRGIRNSHSLPSAIDEHD